MQAFRAVVVFAWLVLLSACGRPQSSYAGLWVNQAPTVTLPVMWTVYLDPTMTEEETEATQQAMLDWSKATRSQVTWQLGVGQPPPWDGKTCTTNIVINKVPSWSAIIANLENQTPPPPGKVTVANAIVLCRSRGVVLIYDRIFGDAATKVTRKEALRQILLHEFGHHLKMRHVAGGIMDPVVSNSAPCLTAADLREFCSQTKGCRKEDLAACPTSP